VSRGAIAVVGAGLAGTQPSFTILADVSLRFLLNRRMMSLPCACTAIVHCVRPAWQLPCACPHTSCCFAVSLMQEANAWFLYLLTRT
jgi:hypothetical protein